MKQQLKEQLQFRAREIDDELQQVLAELEATKQYQLKLEKRAKKLCEEHSEQVHKVFRFEDLGIKEPSTPQPPSMRVKSVMYRAFNLIEVNPFKIGAGISYVRAVIFWWIDRELGCDHREIWAAWMYIVGDQESFANKTVSKIIEVGKKSKHLKINRIKNKIKGIKYNGNEK